LSLAAGVTHLELLVTRHGDAVAYCGAFRERTGGTNCDFIVEAPEFGQNSVQDSTKLGFLFLQFCAT
jgi:hypothetical protein